MLDHLAERAVPGRVARTSGVQAEMELAYAGVHQLCLPFLDHLDRLPAPQRGALGTALGMTEGPAPDRFLVGLAVLNLFSDAASEEPLLCLIDDEQWLDRASAQVLAFVARRLGAESVALVFAARQPTDALAGLPSLVVRGLHGPDARALLDTVLTAPLDDRVRDQIVAETRGNPLALLEVPRAMTPEELAGGFGLPGAVGLSGDLESTFRSRVDVLSEHTRLLLLLAAAEPTGDPALMWRAAERLRIPPDAAAAAVEADLASFSTRVRFRHPLVRSAAYRSGSVHDRKRVHRALAEVTDGERDSDRRAWHLAHAASGPDEDIAVELERSAHRAQRRGGVGAAAAFLERAAALTIDRTKRVDRALAAASAKVEAGAFDVALDLLATTESDRLTDFQEAQADLVRARIAFVTNHGSDAPPLLLKAARRLESIDTNLCRATYIDAITAAMFAGRLSVGADSDEIARAAEQAPRPTGAPRLHDELLDWLIAFFTRDYTAAVPHLRRALAAVDSGVPADGQRRWAWLTTVAAIRGWDDERWHELSARYLDLVRGAGALSDTPLALNTHAFIMLFTGELTTAATLIDEQASVQEAIRSRIAPYAALGLAAMRGDRDTAVALSRTTVAEVTARGEGNGISVAMWATALLHNGFGDFRSALTAAREAIEPPVGLSSANWAFTELVEAAARLGEYEEADAALTQFVEISRASRTDWARGLEARCRALLSDNDVAETLYREAVDLLGRTRIRTDAARAHLLYGEWLRRQRRRGDAREQLRLAHDLFTAMGMRAFAERAGRELQAAGHTLPTKAPTAVGPKLTAQEEQVARLARDGLSNPEIGARLFISARTVQYHLSKVFTKLEINSRSQLEQVLP
ncbi:LuxR family transcriptional regulator [Mycolicibacterium confluentis]|nr:LuxR family transcriptional regulator [Mycolicibacterium confluentis]